MPYKLKDTENEFQVIREGEFEYHTFRHGEVYGKIPEPEKDRFIDINPITVGAHGDAPIQGGKKL